jgi:ankyrin repeat protein
MSKAVSASSVRAAGKKWTLLETAEFVFQMIGLVLFCGAIVWCVNYCSTHDVLHPSFFETVKNGTPREVQAAINSGVDIDYRRDEGTTPLMAAIKYNRDFEVISMLLTAGANVNTRNVAGETALMIAAQDSRTPDVIFALLRAGADPKARDKTGRSAFDYARKNNSVKVSNAYQLLEEMQGGNKVVDSNDVLLKLASSGTSEQLQKAIDSGADFRIQDKDGETVLMYAAEGNPDPDVITKLLKTGAELEARDNGGETALMVAAESGRSWAVIRALLDAGADAKAKSYEGKTAFDYAKDNDNLGATDTYWRLNDAQY